MESAVETLICNFNISFCSKMAVHVLQRKIEKGSNLVFSPLSFQLMLSLIAVGSKGSTLEQLLSFLGSESIHKLIDLSAIVNSVFLSANDEIKNLETGPAVSFVNSAWVDQSYGLKPSFHQVLKILYHATAKEVDFANKADHVTDEINLWVESATKGLIRNLLPQKCLNSDTALVLANALYFKGAWDRKFDVSRTKYKEFYLLNDQSVELPFMTSNAYEKHLYGSFDDYKVLKLPYQNGQDITRQFSMYFFLPNAKDGLPSLIQTFNSNPEIYNKKFELREEELPEFWIPRFKFSFKFEASDTLKELGLELPFSHLAELTEMVDSEKLLVLSEIFHESHIEVNEEGTEAAASTAPRIRKLCRRLNPPSFVADHPFMFMIREEKSRLLFFVGAVLNPILDN